VHNTYAFQLYKKKNIFVSFYSKNIRVVTDPVFSPDPDLARSGFLENDRILPDSGYMCFFTGSGFLGKAPDSAGYPLQP
jgi:hypothetical protein